VVSVDIPYGCEFREAAGGGQIVLFAGRRICKIKDDTLMAEATDLRRNAAIVETLGVSRIMCVVETEEQLFDLIKWQGLRGFRKIKLDCYCYVGFARLLRELQEAGPFHDIVSVDISATNEMPNAFLVLFQELFPDMERGVILGRSFERQIV
jgi:hypothetical protein